MPTRQKIELRIALSSVAGGSPGRFRLALGSRVAKRGRGRRGGLELLLVG
jgi:hypothetical protein